MPDVRSVPVISYVAFASYSVLAALGFPVAASIVSTPNCTVPPAVIVPHRSVMFFGFFATRAWNRAAKHAVVAAIANVFGPALRARLLNNATSGPIREPFKAPIAITQ